MEEGERIRGQGDTDRLRKSASKYDYVKVNVWLSGEAGGAGHHYVLSRYLTSRMLTVTKIRQMKAVQIALELKKQLVDSNMLDISQAQLERTLFGIMEARGFGGEYVKRYRMVTAFFQQRRPLIILICGVHCSGKSTVAQALASRLNLPNVLQTDVIHELLQGGGGQLGPTPLHARWELSDGELVAEFQREARLIRKGVTGDLVKTIRDGKPIIIEGMHLDPGLYLYEFGRHGSAHLAQLLQRAPSSLLPGELSLPAHGGSDGADAAAMLSPEDEAEAGFQPPQPAPGPADAAGSSSDASDDEAGALPGGSYYRGEGNSSALQGASFRKAASFALNAAGEGLHPRITSLAPEPVPAQARPAGGCETQVAGSPGWQWLQQLQLGEDGGGSHSGSRRQRTSTWLSRQSRRLLGLSPRTARPPQPQQEAVLGQPPPRLAGAQNGAEEMQVPGSVFGAAGSSVGSHGGSPRALRKGAVGGTSIGAHPSLAFQASDSQSSEGEADSPPSSPAAARGPAAAEPERSGGGEPGPVFVPIVLCMDDPDHAMLVRQWCRHQDVGDDEGTVERVRQRLMLLQAYLASYAACNVPVIRTSLTDITATTDLLHEYLLECIAIQMERE